MAEEVMYDWGDTGVVQDYADFEALPEGEYTFEVRGFKTERYEKKAGNTSNVPNGCAIAVMQLYCTNEKASGTFFERLYLFSGGMGKISHFFKVVGALPLDYPANTPMPKGFKQMFEDCVTRSGRAKITQRPYTTKDGQKRKGNNIKYILPEAGAAAQAPMGYQQPTQPAYQPQPTYQAPVPQPQQPAQQTWTPPMQPMQPMQPQPPAQPQEQTWGAPPAGVPWGQQG